VFPELRGLATIPKTPLELSMITSSSQKMPLSLIKILKTQIGQL